MARENFEGTNFRRPMMNRANGWLVLETDTAYGDKLYRGIVLVDRRIDFQTRLLFARPLVQS